MCVYFDHVVDGEEEAPDREVALHFPMWLVRRNAKLHFGFDHVVDGEEEAPDREVALHFPMWLVRRNAKLHFGIGICPASDLFRCDALESSKASILIIKTAFMRRKRSGS